MSIQDAKSFHPTFSEQREQVDALNTNAWRLRESDSQKAYQTCQNALHLAESAEYQKGKAESYRILSFLDLSNSRLDEAIEYACQSQELLKDVGDKKFECLLLSQLGVAYWRKGLFEKALDANFHFLAVSLEANIKQDSVIAYSNIGGIYVVKEDYAKALEYLSKGLNLAKELDDKNQQFYILTNLAGLYNQLGDLTNHVTCRFKILDIAQQRKSIDQEASALCGIATAYITLKDYDAAYEYLQKALALNAESTDTLTKASILRDFGQVFAVRKEFSKAEDYLEKSISILKIYGYSQVLMPTLNLTASMYEKIHQNEKALAYYNESLVLAKTASNRAVQSDNLMCIGSLLAKDATPTSEKFSQALDCLTQALLIAQDIGTKDYIYECHERLAALYKVSGDFAKALEHHEAFHRIKEEVFNENSDKQIRNLQVVHQVEQTKRDAELEKQKLLELDRLKSRFFSNLSHEFRTPLTLILSPLEDLLAAPAPKGKKSYRLVREQTLAVMHQNATSLLATINDLLDFAKLDAGKLKPQVERRKMMQFIKGIASSFSEMAEQQDIQFAVQVEAEDGDAFFDKDKLEKVMTNLLSNAFKFTPSGGSISVTATQTPASATITVQDSGIGIPANELPRIYDRFYQVDTKGTAVPQSRTKQGTGIGLAFTKELVELCHGSIAVQSKVGKGTTFVLTLPTAKEAFKPDEIIDRSNESESQPRKQSVMRPQVSTSSKQERLVKDGTVVLVVEDNPDMRSYIKQCFLDDASQGKAKSKKTSYVVIEAANGSEAFDQAVADVPDIIVADVMMPVMDGYEMSRRLKKTEATSHIPIILLTAKSSGESKVEGLEIGVDEYLTKPFRSKELLVRTQNLIEQRNRLRDRYRKELLVQPKEFKAVSADERFLQRAVTLIEQHLDNDQYGVEAFAHDIGLSRSQLHRKLVALIHQSPHKFIQSVRLKRAADLLKQSVGTISQIAFMTGFGSHAHFTKCFREQFGTSPSRYKSR